MVVMVMVMVMLMVMSIVITPDGCDHAGTVLLDSSVFSSQLRVQIRRVPFWRR